MVAPVKNRIEAVLTGESSNAEATNGVVKETDNTATVLKS